MTPALFVRLLFGVYSLLMIFAAGYLVRMPESTYYEDRNTPLQRCITWALALLLAG